jgi:hypothetical protein
MAHEAVPYDVRRFILISIPSVPFLEALLLLHSDPGVFWDCKNLARRIYIDEKKAEDLLSDLQKTGFAITAESSDTSRYRFNHSSLELMSMCDRLAHSYPANIIEVTNLIHSNLNKQAQHFADAFKWVKG